MIPEVQKYRPYSLLHVHVMWASRKNDKNVNIQCFGSIHINFFGMALTRINCVWKLSTKYRNFHKKARTASRRAEDFSAWILVWPGNSEMNKIYLDVQLQAFKPLFIVIRHPFESCTFFSVSWLRTILNSKSFFYLKITRL